MEVLNTYFVYRHIRPDTNQVFYIGMGKYQKKWKYQRAHTTKNRNTYWYNIVNLCQGDYKAEVLFDGLTRDQAVQKEVELIQFYGRSDLKKGRLCNLTDGGDTGCNPAQETKDKISAANKVSGSAAFLRNLPEEIRTKRANALRGSANGWYGKVPLKAILASVEARKGKPRDPKASKKAADSNRGRKRSPEFCELMKESANAQSDMRRERALKQWADRKAQGFTNLVEKGGLLSKF